MKIMKKMALFLGTVLFVQNVAGGIEINNVYASEESGNIAYTVFVSTEREGKMRKGQKMTHLQLLFRREIIFVQKT